MTRLHYIAIVAAMAMALATIIVGASVLADGPGTQKVLSANAEITVASTGKWLTGSRLWLAVTAKNTRDTEIDGPVFEEQPFVICAYSYTLRSVADGKVVVRQECLTPPLGSGVAVGPNGEEMERERPHFRIESRGDLRLLFQVPWPSRTTIEPGEYDLEITVHAVFGELGKAKPQRIVVRAPTEEEKKLLAIMKNDMLHQSPRSDELDRLKLPESLTADTGYAFEYMLYQLCTAPGGISDMDMKVVEADVPSMFLPEVAVLKYEILKAKGEEEPAKTLRKETLPKYPGVEFRFNNVDGSKGPIASCRKLVSPTTKPAATAPATAR